MDAGEDDVTDGGAREDETEPTERVREGDVTVGEEGSSQMISLMKED